MSCRHETPLLDRRDAVAGAMEDERRNIDLLRQLGHVDSLFISQSRIAASGLVAMR